MMWTIRLLQKPKSSVLGFQLGQIDSRRGLKTTLCTELDNEKLFIKPLSPWMHLVTLALGLYYKLNQSLLPELQKVASPE